MDVQIERAAKALDEGDDAGARAAAGREPRAAGEIGLDGGLGKRGLYRPIGGAMGPGDFDQMALLWVLNLSDGVHSLLDIAERSDLPFDQIRSAAEALVDAGLLDEV